MLIYFPKSLEIQIGHFRTLTEAGFVSLICPLTSDVMGNTENQVSESSEAGWGIGRQLGLRGRGRGGGGGGEEKGERQGEGERLKN